MEIQKDKKRNPIWMILTYGAGGMLVLAIGFWFVYSSILENRLDEELSRIRAKGEPLSWIEAAPEMPPEEENAAILWNKLWDELERRGDGSMASGLADKVMNPETITEEDKKEFQEYWERNRDLLPMVREAMKLSKCVYPVKYEDGFAALLPYVEKTIRMAQLLRVRIYVEPETHVESLQMIAAIAESMRKDVSLVSKLVRVVIYEFIWEDLRRSELSKLSDQEREALRTMVKEASMEGEYHESMLAERGLAIQVVQGMIVGDMTLEDLGVTDSFLRLRRSLGFTNSYLRDQLAGYLKFMEIEIEALKHPITLLKRDDVETRSRIQDAGLFVALFSPALRRAAQQFASHEANRRMASYALGRTKELPIDPFTEDTVRTQLEELGVVLWSVGPNLVDDTRIILSDSHEHKDDIVWRVRK